jgi:hypothetical protein
MCQEVDILADGPFFPPLITVAYACHNPAPPDLRARVEARWHECLEAAKRENRTLFNAPVAFLKTYAVRGGSLHLELAPTDYKTFLVTTLRDRDWFERHCPAAITPALGNSIFLTFENTAYLGLRSHAVAAYPGKAHLFGGVLDWPGNQATGPEALLAHLYRELHEELGLMPEALTAPPRLLALLRDPFLMQPELVWHGTIKEPLTTLPAYDAEHDRLVPLTWNPPSTTRQPRVGNPRPPASTTPPLTPVAHATIAMLQRITRKV